MKKLNLSLSFIFLLFLSFLFPGEAAALTANSAKECAICHFNWIDVFYKEGKASDLADYPTEKLVANEMMCYSCHDGSIADSRFKVWETSRHKPGTKPSGKVRIPSFFPLAKDGTVQCFTCHSAHGVDTRPGIEATIFLRASNRDSAMCRECHVGKDLGPKKGMHPIDVTSLDIPEEIIKAGGKAGSKKNQIICQTCHTPHGSTSDKFLIIPNSGKGITTSALCETCHTVKPNIKEKGSMRKHSHPMDITLIAEAKLPEKWENGEVPYLSEDGRINCRTCHSPHNGISNNHLLVQRNEKGSLCVTCHTTKTVVANSKHNMEIMAPDEKNLEGQKVSESGICGTCHFMHKGTAPKMWARQVSEEGDVISKLCKSCHSKDHVAAKKQTGTYSHPVGLKGPDTVAIQGLPLFDDDGNRVKDGKVTCATCHNVHRWDPVSADVKVTRETVGDATNKFLRKRAAPSPDLCFVCHEDKGYVEKTSHDLNISAPKAVNANREPVKKSGICGACHLVHNAKGDKLWARTAGQGDNNIERLCNGCHTAGGVAEEKLTGKFSHPLGKTPTFTESSPKTLPLFNEKGSKDEHGIVTCATCHNVHQWDPAKKDKGPGMHVEGDRFNSFLRAPYDDEVTLCSNCHKNGSVKATKHDLHLSAPDEKNAVGEKAGKVPACSSCHLIHKAKGAKLWAREIPAASDDIISALCLSCHSDGKVAGKKQTGKNSHPLAKRVHDGKDTLKRELEGFYSYSTLELPLFTKEGERSRDGQISCATCHNAHQWDPQNINIGNVVKAEGNAGNKFLRKSNLPDSALCGTCHTEKRYVSRTEHDMAVTAPDAKNLQGKTVAEGGTCSACHLVHNGKEGYKLWAREVGEGDYIPMTLCTSCHKKGGPAEVKLPKYLKHPSDVVALESHKATDLTFVPLYDKNGKESSSGYITCPTCHNPHKWSVDHKGYGPGKNTEGNSLNSFLRVKSSDNMCKNCHGFQGLMRYKFYHTNEFRGGKAAFQ